ncbi:IclR family transcriptional regulator domain-containing protein [Tardiphaga robiniae]|uniref:Helix-turn-helix domain-containing protein n=1 Tax=Tardiphaga robiniae TaxID=943830 RepID=A0A7G6U1I1_9BRAD|nr:IclR family transcriptional regulator C-terminal domain-containing protein [Tardiphaga robiniae]QND72863.1 helix-turn-helix domain-containing protein [Tardiphaga robiniae]
MNELQWSSDLISPKNVVGTALISKACDILEVIGRAPGSVGQAELADRTGIPRATLYRILAALISRGLVRLDPLSENYTLGFNFLELAQNAWSSSDLASIASVELRRLRDLTGETSYLAVQEGNHVLALGRFESAHDKRSDAKLGVLKPMHCTSQGKAMLSHLSEAQRDHVLTSQLIAFTENTITDTEQLKAHLAIVRSRGYAIDDEEIVLGTRCVGAAILDPEGKPIAAISVAGPTFRMHPERAEQLGKELIEAAKRISSQLAPTLRAHARHSGDCKVWTKNPAFIGSSPRWDVRAQSIVWADLLAPSIRIGGHVEEFASLHALSESISSLCLTKNGFICAAGSDILSGDRSGIRKRFAGSPDIKMRSLRASPNGQIWAAGFEAEANVTKIGPWSKEKGLEHLFDLQGEVGDIAFVGERGLMVAQPVRQCIYLLELDTRRKRKFADIPKVAGSPCALAIDEKLNPWVGLSDGWSIIKLDDNGEIERTIALPIPNPTGIAFGGANLCEIFITSARSGLSRDSLTNAPLSGQLLSIEVGERGLPEALGRL